MARRVLFVQTAFLGDAVLATAAWEVWHAQFPEDEISVVVRKGNEGLFEGHPWLGEGAVHVWAKSQPGRYLRLITLGLQLRGRYDCVIAIQRHASSGILALLSGARLRIGYATHPLAWTFHRAVDHVLGDGRHETERLHDLVTAAAAALAALAGTPAPTLPQALPRLHPAPQHVAAAAPYLAGPAPVVLAPASVWATKQWPEERWVELGRILKTSDFARPVVLIGGAVIAPTDLLGTAALLSGAAALVANDSGPVHIASSVNCPTVAVFCSTVPAFGFGPLAPHSIVIEEPLSCRPCGAHGHRTCPLGHFDCGHRITATRVAAACEQATSFRRSL
jgi:heptosyltransferase-2